jgi:hypothetical protein
MSSAGVVTLTDSESVGPSWRRMTSPPVSYKRHGFSREIIACAVWLVFPIPVEPAPHRRNALRAWDPSFLTRPYVVGVSDSPRISFTGSSASGPAATTSGISMGRRQYCPSTPRASDAGLPIALEDCNGSSMYSPPSLTTLSCLAPAPLGPSTCIGCALGRSGGSSAPCRLRQRSKRASLLLGRLK